MARKTRVRRVRRVKRVKTTRRGNRRRYIKSGGDVWQDFKSKVTTGLDELGRQGQSVLDKLKTQENM